MKDKKRTKVLFKLKKKVHDQNPGLKELIEALMVNVCAEEGVSPEQVFFLFCFSLAVVFIIIAILEKNLNKSDEDIKDRLWKL